jgi:hypothetical protein
MWAWAGTSLTKLRSASIGISAEKPPFGQLVLEGLGDLLELLVELALVVRREGKGTSTTSRRRIPIPTRIRTGIIESAQWSLPRIGMVVRFCARALMRPVMHCLRAGPIAVAGR